jgi:hypothetical protein
MFSLFNHSLLFMLTQENYLIPVQCIWVFRMIRGMKNYISLNGIIKWLVL